MKEQSLQPKLNSGGQYISTNWFLPLGLKFPSSEHRTWEEYISLVRRVISAVSWVTREMCLWPEAAPPSHCSQKICTNVLAEWMSLWTIRGILNWWASWVRPLDRVSAYDFLLIRFPGLTLSLRVKWRCLFNICIFVLNILISRKDITLGR